MEYLKFPKKSYYLTQGFGKNTFSHKYRKAIDVSARGGYKEIYAPFSGYVSKIFVKRNLAYTIWLTSKEKVICADNKARYVVFMMTHPNKIINYKVGHLFKQGDYLFDDGTTGGVKAHLDFEIAVYDKKDDIVNDWKNVNGSWGLVNSIDPTKYIIMDDDVFVINDFYKIQNKKYVFKKLSEVKNNSFVLGNYKALYNMYIRKGPGTNFLIKRVKDLTLNGRQNSVYKNENSLALYKKNTIFTALEIINNDNGSIWAKTPSGYICLKDSNNIYCEKI